MGHQGWHRGILLSSKSSSPKKRCYFFFLLERTALARSFAYVCAYFCLLCNISSKRKEKSGQPWQQPISSPLPWLGSGSAAERLNGQHLTAVLTVSEEDMGSPVLSSWWVLKVIHEGADGLWRGIKKGTEPNSRSKWNLYLVKIKSKKAFKLLAHNSRGFLMYNSNSCLGICN